MDLTPSQKRGNQIQFEVFCKRIIARVRSNYMRKLKQLKKHEVLFSELPVPQDAVGTQSAPVAWQHIFRVCGLSAPIRDQELAEALLSLGSEGYTILLLAYYFGLKDWEIAQLLGVSRSGIQHSRSLLLKSIRKLMKEDD